MMDLEFQVTQVKIRASEENQEEKLSFSLSPIF